MSNHAQAHLRDEVCFRIRFLNPIKYPARASINALSMAKRMIDKYWNAIILSCLRFLLILHPGGGKQPKTEKQTSKTLCMAISTCKEKS